MVLERYLVAMPEEKIDETLKVYDFNLNLMHTKENFKKEVLKEIKFVSEGLNCDIDPDECSVLKVTIEKMPIKKFIKLEFK